MIFGSTFDESLGDKIRISVVATGIEVSEMNQLRPAPIPRPVAYPVAEPETVEAPIAVEPAIAATVETPMPEPAITEPAMADVAEATAASPDADMLSLMEAPAAPEEIVPRMPALASEDNFIPAAPVHPEQQGQPEPFAEAALANGTDSGKEQKRRRPGLLELMAEVAGVASGERRPEPIPRERVEPMASPIATKGEAKPAAPPATGQPALGEMDRTPRPEPTEAEGEMLDIPAFLRRQAN
jgi:cell division protein FtsZ